jgi:hypothetical protein
MLHGSIELRRLTGVLIFAALGYGQSAVEGIVLDSLTGRPVAHTHVRIELEGEKGPRIIFATSGTDGRFKFRGLEAGEYSIEAEKVGYAPYCNNSDGDECGFTLEDRENKKDLEVKLVPAGAISGRVLDSTGEPVAFASVSTERGGSARTDDEGRFRIGGLTPGSYRVRADPQHISLPPEIRTDGSAELHHITTYYPGTIQRKLAARVAVAPGAETEGLEIRLAAAPIIRVSGRVLNADRAKQVWISGNQRNGVGLFHSVVRADGTFTLWRLTPGKYVVRVAGELSPGELWASAEQALQVEQANIEGLEFLIMAPFEVKGHLEPRVGIEDLRVTMRLVGTIETMTPADRGTDGAFQFTQVRPGRYQVRLSSGYVKSVRAGPEEIEGSIVDLSRGSPGELIVRVGLDAASVSGMVKRDDKPASGARVVAVEDHPDALIPARVAVADQQGNYSLENLAPGRYKLFVATPDVPIAPLNLEDLPDEFATVDLQGGDKLVKELTLKPAK